MTTCRWAVVGAVVGAVGAAVDADALVLRYRHYYDEPDAPRMLPMPGALEALRCVRAVGGRTVVGANDAATMLAARADLALPDLDTFVAWLPAHVSEAPAQ